MEIAIASMLQESNTFSPVYTRYDDFQPVFGKAVIERHAGKLTEMGGFLDVLQRAKVEAVPICAAWAITANRLLRPDFERLLAEFTKALEKARPDALLLAMHGAQTAEGEDDVEGCVLARAREILGSERPIVLTLDLHANITKRIVELANAIVGYHTYPHVDMFETGQKAARLMLRIVRGECRPAMAFRKLPLILQAENSQTYRGPMHKLIQAAQRLEASGKAEAVSIFPVQPWMDIAEMGCAVVAVTNNDARAATRHADALAARLWKNRKAYEVKLTGVPEALAAADKIKGGPVVLAESSDSTGSGSPGDSTGVLKHLLKARLSGPAAIFLVDPAAVAKAIDAGIGATVTMTLGAAFDRKNSKPVKVNAHVKIISDGRWIARARGYNTGIVTAMGRSVVLEVGQVLILAAERSAMTVDPELFRSHGIDPIYCKIVVVKSPNGFRAAYEPIAKGIFLVDTPGVSTANFATLPFKRIPRPIYPLDPGTAPPGDLRL
ncbi:MAG TPA: M81 family metallopeptidase [Bryobacteraceae bacterium]|nr:M81 family metallopeptidase [Bryobacteraceae bacterium]